MLIFFGGYFVVNLRGYILENVYWVYVSSDKVIYVVGICMMYGILYVDWIDVEKL